MVDRSSNPDGRGREALRVLTFLLLYSSAIVVGRATSLPPSELALAWPAAGVSIAWLLWSRSRRETVVGCALIVLATVAMNQATGLEAPAAWLFGGVNLAHGLIGSAVLRAWRGPDARSSARSLRDVAALGTASLAAASASAVLGGLVSWARLGGSLLDGVDMIGPRNALSSFVVVNALVACAELWDGRRRRGLAASGVVGVGALVLTAGVLLVPWPVGFAIVPIVIAVALRCGPQVTAVVVALQGVLVVAVTRQGEGQFAGIDAAEPRVIVAQGFILVLAVMGMVMSILEQERDEALQRSEHDRERLQDHVEAALVASAHVVVDADEQWRCDAVNAAMVALTGCDRAELHGTDPRRWMVPDDATQLDQALGRISATDVDGWRGQLRLADEWGGAWVDVAVAHVREGGHPAAGAPRPGTTAITLQMVDLTAQRRAEQALEHAALHDDLTGLGNRALWTSRLDEALRAAGLDHRPVVVMYIDVDHFKRINDGYGHDVGDEVLRDIGRRLAALVGPGGTVARIGGDEFALLDRLDGWDQARETAERIEHAMLAPTHLRDGRFVSFTLSIGIADTTGKGIDGRLLLRRADVALYRAKEQGRGRFERFEPSLLAGPEASARLLLDLERGHAADEFGLVYQPIVDATTGEVTAVEALLRWDHPQRGRLCPAAFLDVLEASELMHEVGDRALRAACAVGGRLAARGTAVAMHVNVSANELARPQLVERVRAALEASDLAPENLVLEVTETRLIAVNGSLLEDLVALRALGVRIAVDDFGTGFSTLTHLVDLPLDIIKLDSSFVAGVLAGGAARSVCAGVIAMADGLGVETVAEGVETLDQAEVLQSMGYRLMQGYRWGSPMDEARLARVCGTSVR